MAHSATYPLVPAGERTRAAAVPWYIWCCLLAILSSSIGSAWDIAWHKSIGRDSFWTPAHVLIYLCGVLAGLGCGYLILSVTFRKDSALREGSIAMWGFHGPLGAFICAWGGVAMITSAPFDNWWHGAYGLDGQFWGRMALALAVALVMARIGLGWGDWMRRVKR